MDARTIRTRSGQEFEVLLEETPTSGYRWQMGDSVDGVELISDSYSRTASGLVGGGGRRRFLLRATRPGTFTLDFTLRREWEATPLEQRNMVVEVA